MLNIVFLGSDSAPGVFASRQFEASNRRICVCIWPAFSQDAPAPVSGRSEPLLFPRLPYCPASVSPSPRTPPTYSSTSPRSSAECRFAAKIRIVKFVLPGTGTGPHRSLVQTISCMA